MIIEDIVAKINTEGIAELNTDLFIGELPLNKTECIAAMPSPSPEPHKTFDNYEQHIDFWSRYKNSTDGPAKLKQIQDAFHRQKAYELDNYYVYFSNALGAIEDMDRDIERRKLFKLSIRFIYRPLS